MRHLFTLLAALLLLAAPAAAQTMKALMFNSTNGQVVANTETLLFTNVIRTADSLYLGTNLASIFSGSGEVGMSEDGGDTIFVASSQQFKLIVPIAFDVASVRNASRTNLGLSLPALTNTSNVTAMRALAGSTNTNEPYSGTVALTNTNVLTFSNGVLLKIE